MIPIDSGAPPALKPLTAPHNTGSALGKRYTTADGALEVLCTKGGDGSLSIGDEPLVIKGMKPIPSSD